MQLIATALLFCAACGAHFSEHDRTMHTKDLAFQVGELPSTWTRTKEGRNQVAFQHPKGGVIAASGHCDRREDIPLDVATNHLLLGFTDRHIDSQRRLTLDERGALRSTVRASLDGVPLDLDLIVLKKDGCIYDLQLVGTPATLAAYRNDFASFVGGFHVVSSP